MQQEESCPPLIPHQLPFGASSSSSSTRQRRRNATDLEPGPELMRLKRNPGNDRQLRSISRRVSVERSSKAEPAVAISRPPPPLLATTSEPSVSQRLFLRRGRGWSQLGYQTSRHTDTTTAMDQENGTGDKSVGSVAGGGDVQCGPDGAG